MADFEHIPVVCINRNNMRDIWPSLKLSITTATFISIDTELSGLGKRKDLLLSSIDDRYKAMKEVANTRSIISLGLSCFKMQERNGEEESPSRWKYLVQTYNILTLCSDEYVVEPKSVQFLVEHGFNFNQQYSSGLFYYRGSDQSLNSQADEKSNVESLRNLFEIILAAKKPLVLHNAFVDLAFLYHNLYANIPATLSTFLADLHEMFPSGVFDTKYIAEYHVRTNASYLEYLFCKSQKINADVTEQQRIELEFLKYVESPSVEYRFCGKRNSDDSLPICRNFASYGWCEQSNECPKSHDVNKILNYEDDAVKCKRRRKSTDPDSDRRADPGIATNESEGKKSTEETTNQRIVGHRAGFDAFMTGFAFTTFVSKYADAIENFESPKIKELLNNIYLVRKDFPLLINKSTFAKTSKDHQTKMLKLNFHP